VQVVHAYTLFVQGQSRNPTRWMPQVFPAQSAVQGPPLLMEAIAQELAPPVVPVLPAVPAPPVELPAEALVPPVRVALPPPVVPLAPPPAGLLSSALFEEHPNAIRVPKARMESRALLVMSPVLVVLLAEIRSPDPTASFQPVSGHAADVLSQVMGEGEIRPGLNAGGAGIDHGFAWGYPLRTG
jgi:hypothetical protein